MLTVRLLDPCGTNRLGKDIKQGVVSSELKVHGVENLRVMDASVIPVIPDCRIQNSVYMIGERVSYYTFQTPARALLTCHRVPK